MTIKTLLATIAGAASVSLVISVLFLGVATLGACDARLVELTPSSEFEPMDEGSLEPVDQSSESSPESVDESLDSNTDSNTDGNTDSNTDADPAHESAHEPDCDKDGDGFCPFDSHGNVVDCDDTALDEDGDGISDGRKFGPEVDDVCDGIDNNCNGEIDEDAVFIPLHFDGDGDGYGVGPFVYVCNVDEYTEIAGDCDDENDAIYPGAPDEPGDAVDADCDDEPNSTYVFYLIN